MWHATAQLQLLHFSKVVLQPPKLLTLSKIWCTEPWSFILWGQERTALFFGGKEYFSTSKQHLSEDQEKSELIWISYLQVHSSQKVS